MRKTKKKKVSILNSIGITIFKSVIAFMFITMAVTTAMAFFMAFCYLAKELFG